MIGNEFERLRRNILINRTKDSSYIMLNNGSKIEFDIENTPIEDFCNGGNVFSTMTINGVSFIKEDVVEIYFGSSYSTVQSVGDNFIRGFRNLTIKLNGLFSLESTGSWFLAYNSNAFNVFIGSKDYTNFNAGIGAFYGVGNNSNNFVYADTIALANTFKAKFPNLSNWSVAVG